MTRHVRSAITCDQDGCTEMVVRDDSTAYKVAQASGWLRVRRGPRAGGRHIDLCPAHREVAS